MSLIAFHRLLIATGILFCFGYAGWELVLWWVTQRGTSLLFGATFAVLGLALSFYLSRLRHFVGYQEEERGVGPGRGG